MSYEITNHLQVAAVSYLTCDVSEVIWHYLTETFGSTNFVNSGFQLRMPGNLPLFLGAAGQGFQTPSPSDCPFSLGGRLWHWHWEEALESWVGILACWEIFKGASEWGAAAGGLSKWAFVWVYDPVSSRIWKRDLKRQKLSVCESWEKQEAFDKSVFYLLSSRGTYLTINSSKYYGNWTKI